MLDKVWFTIFLLQDFVDIFMSGGIQDPEDPFLK